MLGAFAIGLVALAGFIGWELHTDHPMLDMSFFKNPRFSAANTAITLTFFALFGSLFLMTQYWQFVHGYSPLQAGVRLIPYAAALMLTRPAVGPAGRAGGHQAGRHHRPARHRRVAVRACRSSRPTRPTSGSSSTCA